MDTKNGLRFDRRAMPATVRVPGRGEIAGARVSSQVMPQFDSATQAVRVRIDADNPGYVLRPGMPDRPSRLNPGSRASAAMPASVRPAHESESP